MSVLDRDALEGSPLADLHIIASELGLDGYRRLRKPELVDAILDRQGGEADDGGAEADGAEAGAAEVDGAADTAAEAEAEADTTDAAAEAEADGAEAEDADADAEPASSRRRGRRRGGRGRGRAVDADSDGGEEAAASAEDQPVVADEEEAKPPADGDRPARARRSRGGRGRSKADDGAEAREDEGADEAREERAVEGTVELLSNGSGFIRVTPPEPSEDDVYISAAQVRRCELVSGDTVTGPMRPPRRSERYPSLVRVETINGRPADEVAEGTRFEDLPVTYPTDRFKLGSEDPTLKAAEFLTPFGRGSRVVITGASRAGKTEALRRLAAAVSGQEDLEASVVLAGVRPEEIAEWRDGPVAVAGAVSFAASPDAQATALERAVEHAQRIAARGGDALLLVDTLDGLPQGAARRALAAARNLTEAGSLTVVATAAAPLGGETTVIALDLARAATGQLPAIDLMASGTIRPELLVGESGAEAIASARADAVA